MNSDWRRELKMTLEDTAYQLRGTEQGQAEELDVLR